MHNIPMLIDSNLPSTLQEAIQHFSDEMTCIAAVAEMRWEDGKPTCPSCGKQDHYWLQTQKRWKCKSCKRQFSVKRGTIFENSPIGLDKWLLAIWMLGNCRNGVSSYEIARAIGITQKSAWHMMHRIREAMTGRDGRKLGGADSEIEIDESYLGGKVANMHLSRKAEFSGARSDHKTIVMGTLDRTAGKVRAEVIPAANREVMDAMVRKNVKYGSTVYTDAHVGYNGLKGRYTHDFVTHVDEYVRGRVHTNGIENFWSLLKRGLGGTYVSVSPAHLERYVNEQVFRFNHRKDKNGKLNDGERFAAILKDVGGRKLTYAELTGRGEIQPF
jgi:transposase-like protein